MDTQKKKIELRPAEFTDIPEIMAFDAAIHADKRVPMTIQDLLDVGKMSPEDFLLARDIKSGQVISSCCLIPQNIQYGDIPLKVGQPELVGTDPAYRRMGLVSQQFAELHRWSEARGDDLQIIAGIPNFYRQYGYEMTINLDARRMGALSELDALPQEPSTLFFHSAVPEDIPTLMRLFAEEGKRVLVAHQWSELDWRYCILDSQKGGCAAKHLVIIRRENGQVLGAVKTQRFIDEGKYFILGAEIDPVVTTWEEVIPPLLQFYKASALQAIQMDQKTIQKIGIQIPENHPLVNHLTHLFPEKYNGYAWYVRVPDLLVLLKKIKPVLEENIHNSAYQGLNRVVKINGYSSGFEIEFHHGKLIRIEPWQASSWEDGDFLCPEKVLYHLIFGHRSFQEIHDMFVDCYAKKDNGSLMDALFPKKISFLCPVL
jgi:predicted N-acetyltransferase YhbS